MLPTSTSPLVEANPRHAPARSLISRVFGDLSFHTDGELLALAFAEDDTLWSMEEPGRLRQWDVVNGHALRETPLSDLEPVWTFSNRAQLLASASDDLYLWGVASARKLCDISQPSWVNAVAISPDLRYVATGHDDKLVRIWDVTTQQQIHELRGHHLPISALAFSPNGSCLASASEDRSIRLWKVATGQLMGLLTGHTDRIPSLVWHPQGNMLVSAGWDKTARVWDTQKCEPVILLNTHADQLTALAFSPDAQWLACADSANSIHVWDPRTWQTLHVLKGHTDEIRCLAFGRDRSGERLGRGHLLVSGGVDQVIRTWNLLQGRLLSDSNSTTHHVISLSPSSNGSRLASTGDGMALRMWNADSVQPILHSEIEHGFQAVALSPDGRWLAGGGTDAHVRIWDALTGQLEKTLEGQGGSVADLAFAPDGVTLASANGSDGTVWLWHVPSNHPLLLIPEAADGCTVESVAFHPQGHLLACAGIDWLATGGSDGAICIWNLLQSDQMALFEHGSRCVRFHPSGRWLAAASLVETIYIWDVQEQRLIRELTGHRDAVTCVAYSPDGRWLVSGSDNHLIRLWEAASGELAAEKVFETSIKSLSFSPDSQHLFTGNGNTTCYQLDVKQLLS